MLLLYSGICEDASYTRHETHLSQYTHTEATSAVESVVIKKGNNLGTLHVTHSGHKKEGLAMPSSWLL